MGEFIKTGVKAGVILQEYKGAYSLTAGFQADDGKINLEWSLGSHWDKATKQKVKNDKETPIKIYLGNKGMAIEVLKALLWELEGDPQVDPSVPEEDIPF